jgi:hypothetical protein
MGRPMFAAFVQPIAASILLVASGSQVPRFDIEQICQSTSEVHWNHATMHNCRHDERAARNDLRHQWLKIPLRFREQCAASDTDVSPSYVELSACIQTDLDLDKGDSSSAHNVPAPDSDDQ